MVIDFHTHGKITNQFPFDEEGFQKKIEEAKQEGLDAIALTEHSHAKNFSEAYHYLEKNFEFIDQFYLVNGVKVFTGVEVTTKEKLDVLFIGERNRILAFNQQILKQTKEKDFIAIQDLFHLVNYQDFLVILAHPYRKQEELPKFDQAIFRKMDAIEFNARDLYDYGIERMMEKVKKLGKAIQLPITGGSDSHYFLQIGSIRNRFQKDCSTVAEMKEQIHLNQYSVELSNELSIRVRASKIIKKLIING